MTTKRNIKIVNIIGARPNIMKIAPLVEEMKKHRRIEPLLVHTGQHYDAGMSDVFFRELSIPRPDYNLGVGSGPCEKQIAEMVRRLETALVKESPDIVFVYGDTNSTLAGALASERLDIPLAHVEAGLRSFNRAMPEEANRVKTDRMSNILFCPTRTAVENLRREGITKGVYLVGDVMLDMLARYAKEAKRSRILARLGLKNGGYYLATVHRAGNTDDVRRLKALMRAFDKLDKTVVFPAHPRTAKAIVCNGIKVGDNIALIKPVSYFDMLALEMGAAAILTDSGGVQKEAAFFKVPCVTLRDETEWVETVKSGWNILTGVSEAKIDRALAKFARCRPRTRTYPRTAGSAHKMLQIALKFMKGRE